MTVTSFKNLKVGDEIELIDTGVRYWVREVYLDDNDICACDECGWTIVKDFHDFRRIRIR